MRVIAVADLEAVAAWRALAEDRAGLDPIAEAAANRERDRAAILPRGDAWVRQALRYEQEQKGDGR